MNTTIIIMAREMLDEQVRRENAVRCFHQRTKMMMAREQLCLSCLCLSVRVLGLKDVLLSMNIKEISFVLMYILHYDS